MRAGSSDESASYSWSLLPENTAADDLSDPVLAVGRDPRVLTIPPLTLGYAGNKYVLGLSVEVGSVSNGANATGACVAKHTI